MVVFFSLEAATNGEISPMDVILQRDYQRMHFKVMESQCLYFWVKQGKNLVKAKEMHYILTVAKHPSAMYMTTFITVLIVKSKNYYIFSHFTLPIKLRK